MNEHLFAEDEGSKPFFDYSDDEEIKSENEEYINEQN